VAILPPPFVANTVEEPAVRASILGLHLVVLLAPCVVAAEPSVERNERRCAYIGYCGSFTLIGDTGTAAYKIGNNRYLADIELENEDENWWVYAVRAHGDGATKGWAFSRHPHGGRYRVLRYSNGAWRLFDRSEAWGIGLGESFGEARTAVRDTGPSNQELLNVLRDIEGKLKTIQPESSPSLKDIEYLIKSKP
jgi:hypothetical protein